MKVAVLGAGGPAGVNTLRALQTAGHECIAVDKSADHLVWCEQYAQTRLMPSMNLSEVRNLGADVVIPQPDSIALWLSQHRNAVHSLIPEEGTMWACQDKYRAALRWYRTELRAHPPVPIQEPWPDHLHLAREAFGLPFWLRATKGAGAKGAILVRSLDTAYHWIRFWETRGAGIEWIAEEHLPGRDFAWSSIWADGELITSFARERLEYLYPHLTPEGLTGTPTIARIVCDAAVNASAREAVLAMDPRPNGIYSVDLKEDAGGAPRPTEINAGRGFTTLGLWSLHSLNFLNLVVWLAAGVSLPELPAYDVLPEGLTLYRHIDCGHVFLER